MAKIISHKKKKITSRKGKVVVGRVGLESGKRGEHGGGVPPDVADGVVDGVSVDRGLAEVDGGGGHAQREVDVERPGRGSRRISQ